jgi:hypothetical protein
MSFTDKSLPEILNVDGRYTVFGTVLTSTYPIVVAELM